MRCEDDMQIASLAGVASRTVGKFRHVPPTPKHHVLAVSPVTSGGSWTSLTADGMHGTQGREEFKQSSSQHTKLPCSHWDFRERPAPMPKQVRVSKGPKDREIGTSGTVRLQPRARTGAWSLSRSQRCRRHAACRCPTDLAGTAKRF